MTNTVDGKPKTETPGFVIDTHGSQMNRVLSPIERLSKAAPSNVQEIAASQIELLATYHKVVLDQAKKSFLWALVAAIVGLLFILAAIALQIYLQSVGGAVISTIGGVLIEFISAINFYLYGKTSLQMASFQVRLDSTQRFLLANSMCEALSDEYKSKTRAELIWTIVHADLGVNEKTQSENTSESTDKRRKPERSDA